MSKNLFATLGVFALALTLSACDKSSNAEEQAPLATVRIETIEAGPLSITSELSGRIAAPRIAEVRARVAGVVLQRTFNEGSDVKKGDVLFRIDPAPFKADLDSAEAALRKAEANAFQARLQEQRYAQLIEGNAISGQDYDNARASVRQTAADVAANKAAVERAKLNLGYATVTAPISGRVGRALVTEGALVGQNETTPMALIQQLNPIHADLTQSTRELNDLRRAFRSGQLQQVQSDIDPGRRQSLSAAGQAVVHRHYRGPGHGPDHLAQRVSQPGPRFAAGQFCACAPGAGGEPTRHQRAATGDPA
jgi:membrane fusion protein (multidrug efflux system)